MKFSFAPGATWLLLASVWLATLATAPESSHGQDEDDDFQAGHSINVRVKSDGEKSAGPKAGDPAARSHDPNRRQVAVDGAALKESSLAGPRARTWRMLGALRDRFAMVRDSIQHFYKVELFERVMVDFLDDIVSSIVVYLDRPLPATEVTRQLDLVHIKGVDVTDPKGNLLGQAYPERGVLLGYLADSGQNPAVSQIVLEPIDAQPFLLRAETNLRRDLAQSIADAEFAVRLDDRNARAHCILAQGLLAAGQLERAGKAAQSAVSIDSRDPEYRLTLAQALARAVDYAAAKEQAEHVAGTEGAHPLVRARAYCELGDDVAAMSGSDYQTAIRHHMQAIKLAEPWATHDEVARRRAAKEVMLDAHLGVAHDIAWGKWQQKKTVVVRWLQRAAELAEELIEREQGSKELRFRVHQQALASLAGVRGAPDVDKWIEGTLDVGKRLVEQAEDPLAKRAMQWRLGLALTDAVAIVQAQSRHDSALEYAHLAATYLKEGSKAAEQWPNRDYVMGRLYYRLGAVYAVRKDDHKRAITWYEQAVSLLESPVPTSALVDGGRLGETFVSMGVSYWEVGGREEAMRLTRQGAKMMEQAVEEGLLEKAALAVPYSNLSSMHQQLGDDQHAREFAELSAKLEKSGKKSPK